MKIFGVVGYKNSGKTTLVERLVAELTGQGLRVSTIKHAHHGFDLDQEGTDSFRHRAAGAAQVAIVSSKRWAVMTEVEGDAPTLAELLADLSDVDLVIVEGFKTGTHPRIEAYRGGDLIASEDPSILAVASEGPLELDRPVFALNDVAGIAAFALANGAAP